MKYFIFLLITSYFLLTLSGCSSVIKFAEKYLPAEYTTGALIDFATCLSTTGFTMYGTAQCQNCDEQLDLFGPATGSLTYINCDDADVDCLSMGIQSFPTRVGKQGGGVYVGVHALETLASVSGCPLMKSGTVE